MPHIPQEIRNHICSFLSFRPKTKTELIEALKETLSRNLKTRQLAKPKYGPIEEWDTSCIRDMSNLFFLFKEFNRDISRWNVSRVVNFQGMFQNCYKFNINFFIFEKLSFLGHFRPRNHRETLRRSRKCRVDKFSAKMDGYRPLLAQNYIFSFFES